MSLAGPYGEAACRYCRHLVDLGEDRRLVVHGVGGNRAPCQGSGTYAHTVTEKELPELAFHADPVTRHCPGCGQLVVVNTIGVSRRAGWRYSYHKMPQLKAAKSWGQPASDCPHSGQLVTPRPLGVDAAQVQVQGPEGQRVDLDGVTGIRIDPF